MLQGVEAAAKTRDGRTVREDVGVIPLGGRDDLDVGAIGIEVAGVFVGFDDAQVAATDAGGRGRLVGRRRRHERTDEAARLSPCRGDEPAGAA